MKTETYIVPYLEDLNEVLGSPGTQFGKDVSCEQIPLAVHVSERGRDEHAHRLPSIGNEKKYSLLSGSVLNPE